MNLETAVIVLILAFVILYIGAELALESGEKVGQALGISPLLIGLLIIGTGTSLPELFVSHLAALNGRGQIAIGNIVGSNVCNLLLVLGISMTIQRIALVKKETFYQAGIHLLLTVFLCAVLAFDELYPLSCVALIGFFAAYLFHSYGEAKKSKRNDREKTSGSVVVSWPKLVGKLLLGFSLLYVGGEALVRSGSSLCRFLGISEYTISVIFIALGTGLPELFTSFLATMKKKNLDIIVGNIIGSNIFNVALVMGSLVFYRIDLSRSFMGEMIALMISSLLLFAFAFKRWALNRVLGISFVGMYAFMVYYWAR
ncbi:MAG: sodium:calcium antiporter [Bacteriovoracales bacterium]|nr:sodium:calcium antiporter [Bacteriovoracales bacterium]